MTSQTGPLGRGHQQRAAQVSDVEVVLPCPQYRLRDQDVTTDEALRATPISLSPMAPNQDSLELQAKESRRGLA